MIKAVIPEENRIEIPTSLPRSEVPGVKTPSIFTSPVVSKLSSLEHQLLSILDQKILSPEIKLKIYGNLLSSAISLNKCRKSRGNKNTINQSVQTDNRITNPLLLNRQSGQFIPQKKKKNIKKVNLQNILE